MAYQFGSLQDRIGYHFNDERVLLQALTHSSYIHEHRDEPYGHNERLEFLGDAVLEIVIRHLLFRRFPSFDEGTMSRIKADLVKQATLASIARSLDLGTRVRLGSGEEITGGREKDSVLAGALEALFAAVYLDGGYQEAFFVVGLLSEPLFERIEQGAEHEDFKTRLQEVTQRTLNTTPTYTVTGEYGPAHEKTFCVAVTIAGEILGRGAGRSKKEAEQQAASAALRTLVKDTP